MFVSKSFDRFGVAFARLSIGLVIPGLRFARPGMTFLIEDAHAGTVST